MRKIILASLFFCLAITIVLAQSTTNIAAPDSNGLSNNQVNSFDVNTDGTILNNSAAGGTAQLGATAVVGNSNITAGSEADLILFQVTGTSGSDLEGTIEVFGGEAGLIIANPNGIDCDGCGFINTSKVELVTWNRIRSASLPAVILLLPTTAVAPNCAVPPAALLFKIVPSVLTSKLLT